VVHTTVQCNYRGTLNMEQRLPNIEVHMWFTPQFSVIVEAPDS